MHCILSSVLFIILISDSLQDMPCPDGFNSLRNLCSNKISAEQRTFADAQQQCKTVNATLVIPLTEPDAVALAAAFNNEIWVDLEDKLLDEKYIMSNGMDFANQYLNIWAPDGASPASATDNCVSMDSTDGKFQLRNCSQLNNFVCSKPRASCNLPYVSIGGMCYTTLTNAHKTAINAIAQCDGAGGFPPFPNSFSDSVIIDDYRKARLNVGQTLIGFNATHRSAPWRNMFDQSIATYIPWRKGLIKEPNGPANHVYARMSLGDHDLSLNNMGGTGFTGQFFCQSAPINCMSFGFSVMNGAVKCYDNKRKCEVQCDDGYQIRGKSELSCGITAVWNKNKEVFPICVETNPTSLLRVKMNWGVNPTTKIDNIITGVISSSKCSMRCFETNDCVDAVYDELENLCMMFSKRLTGEEIIQVKRNELIQFGI